MTIYQVTLISDNVNPETVLVEASSPKIAKRKAQHYLSPNGSTIWVPTSTKAQSQGIPVA